MDSKQRTVTVYYRAALCAAAKRSTQKVPSSWESQKIRPMCLTSFNLLGFLHSLNFLAQELDKYSACNFFQTFCTIYSTILAESQNNLYQGCLLINTYTGQQDLKEKNYPLESFVEKSMKLEPDNLLPPAFLQAAEEETETHKAKCLKFWIQ